MDIRVAKLLEAKRKEVSEFFFVLVDIIYFLVFFSYLGLNDFLN